MVDFSTRLMVGLDDLRGLFQPERFYDSQWYIDPNIDPLISFWKPTEVLQSSSDSVRGSSSSLYG